jgi:RNA 2',3'-cyclic 3'-phosphodiesterase
VSSPGSVVGDERLRLFLALRLPGHIVDTLADWQSRHLRGRIVPPANLHITLAFLGFRPARELESICAVLGEAAAEVAPPQLDGGRYRETRSAGMLVLSDRTGNSARLAARLHEELAALGVYKQEQRPWLPHVTVVRYRERPRLSPPPPELRAFAPSDAAAFLSRLHPSGGRTTGPEYVVLKSFPLGG